MHPSARYLPLAAALGIAACAANLAGRIRGPHSSSSATEADALCALALEVSAEGLPRDLPAGSVHGAGVAILLWSDDTRHFRELDGFDELPFGWRASSAKTADLRLCILESTSRVGHYGSANSGLIAEKTSWSVKAISGSKIIAVKRLAFAPEDSVRVSSTVGSATFQGQPRLEDLFPWIATGDPSARPNTCAAAVSSDGSIAASGTCMESQVNLLAPAPANGLAHADHRKSSVFIVPPLSKEPLPNPKVLHLEYSDDGRTLVAIIDDGLSGVASRFQAWAMPAGSSLGHLSGWFQTFETGTFALDPRGRWMAVATHEALIQVSPIPFSSDPIAVIDLSLDPAIRSLGIPTSHLNLGRMAASRDGTRIAVVVADKAIVLWSLTNQAVLATIDLDARGRDSKDHVYADFLGFSGDGSLVLVDSGGHLSLYDSASGARSFRAVVPHGSFRAAALSPGGDLLLIGREVWDLSVPRTIQLLPTPETASGGAVGIMQRDGRLLAYTTSEQVLKAFDLGPR